MNLFYSKEVYVYKINNIIYINFFYCQNNYYIYFGENTKKKIRIPKIGRNKIKSRKSKINQSSF